MEEGNNNEVNTYVRVLWFTIGYLVAVIIDELSAAITDYFVVTKQKPSGFVVSENGTESNTGERVTELVKERVEDE